MTRCRQTDALLDAAFAGLDLTRPEADHAAACAECAHALAQLRRFEGELERIGHELAPEPMPPSDEAATASMGESSGRPTLLPSGALGIGVAVAALALTIGGAQWLGSFVGGPFGRAGVVGADELEAWLARAFEQVVEETGRAADAADWSPVQVELCGRTAIAFWAEKDDGARAYRWAVGDPLSRLMPLRAAGLAGSIGHLEVARLRVDLPVCEVVQDVSPRPDEALAAVDAAREEWKRRWNDIRAPQPFPEADELSRSRVIDASLAAPGSFWVLLERPNERGMDRIALSEDGSTYRLESGSVDGALPELGRVYVDPGLNSALYYGAMTDRTAAAVEFIGPDLTLRYTVDGAGFVLDVPVDLERLVSYRILNRAGDVIDMGEIRHQCGEWIARGHFSTGRAEVACVSSDR